MANYATYYGSPLHPEQVQLGEPDKYGIRTFVEPYDPRLKQSARDECGHPDRDVGECFAGICFCDAAYRRRSKQS